VVVVTQRLFLAAALIEDARHALATRLEAMIPGGAPGRVVPIANWHVTLRFLGTVTEVRRDRLLATLDEDIDGAPFTVRLTGLGAFPKPSRATVLWVGVDDPTGGLERLAGRCEEAARAVGLEPEERPFHPHVTLARIRPALSVAALIDGTVKAGVRFRVDVVTLYRTLTGGKGARYEVADTIDLTGRRVVAHRPGTIRASDPERQ